jgi:uncharacterized phiE125 gp8 family phage protein
MRPHYSIVSAAQTEPLTLEQASEHVRIDSTDDLAYLNSLVSVAREYVDSVTGRVSIQTTFKVVAPSWHALINGYDELINIPQRNLYSIPIFRAPLVSVSNVKYYPADTETLTTVSSSDYRVITLTEIGMIQFKETPPEHEDRPDAVQIEFIAGYSDSCNVPPILAHAQKMLVAHLYENRVPAAFASVSEIPFTLKTLIENQKIGGWIA